MAQMNISNTLWNDTRDAIIAYAKQLHDNTIDWTNSGKKYNGEYENPDYDPEDPGSPQYLPIMPSDYTSNSNSKLQSSLNEFFLNKILQISKYKRKEPLIRTRFPFYVSVFL